ncbi:MAG: DsbA family protein [Gemmatimonadota bacterium]
MRYAIALLLVLVCAVPLKAQDQKMAERAAMNRLKGQQNAIVTVYEIADFQCPYCARFSREVFPRIDSAYVRTGKAKWIFVNFPLPTHANAWAAAEAAMCAGGVSDKFWPMHDKLFLMQAEWAVSPNASALFGKYAQEVGTNAGAYAACIGDDRMAPLIVRDLLNAAGAGVSGTPAFVVNNEPIFAGYRPFEEWQTILDAAIRKAASK